MSAPPDKLAKSLTSPEPLPPLYTLLSNVQELIEAREDAIAQREAVTQFSERLELTQQIDALQVAIDSILSEEIIGKKADGIAGLIKHGEAMAAEAKMVEQNAAAHRRRWEDLVAFVKERTLFAIQAHGGKPVKSATRTLRVQNNSSQKVDVPTWPRNPSGDFVPFLLLWENHLSDGVDQINGLPARYLNISAVPSMEAIREELARLEKCPECGGIGANHNNSAAIPCQRCEGRGTIPATVAGARLLDRGVHLRVD